MAKIFFLYQFQGVFSIWFDQCYFLLFLLVQKYLRRNSCENNQSKADSHGNDLKAKKMQNIKLPKYSCKEFDLRNSDLFDLMVVKVPTLISIVSSKYGDKTMQLFRMRVNRQNNIERLRYNTRSQSFCVKLWKRQPWFRCSYLTST